MRALIYRNTRHTIPGWVPFQEKEPRGIAYETDTHFVHIFGRDRGLWTISDGLTATERKAGSLNDWVERTFGAEGIEETTVEVGHTVEGVWRPGLYSLDETLQGLSATPAELRLAEQVLLLLVHRLDELLHFVEPSAGTLATYSHKARELLILACTEAESYFRHYLQMARVQAPQNGVFTTNDYVRLKDPLFLDEFEVSLPRYPAIAPMRPFLGWSNAPSPTRTLPSYDAYGKTKHDRQAHFAEASLQQCLHAVAANLVLFSVRFGPLQLYNGAGTLAALFNQLFSIDLRDTKPKTFYAPSVRLPPNQRQDLICFGAKELVQLRIADPLRL